MVHVREQGRSPHLVARLLAASALTAFSCQLTALPCQAQQIDIRQPDRQANSGNASDPSHGTGGAGEGGRGHQDRHGHPGPNHHGHHDHHGHHGYHYSGHGFPDPYGWGFPGLYGYGLNAPIYSAGPGFGYGSSIYSSGYPYTGYPFTGVYGSPWLYARPNHYANSIGLEGLSVVQPGPWELPGAPWHIDAVPRPLIGAVAPAVRERQPGPAAAVDQPGAMGVVGENQAHEAAEIQRRVDVLQGSTPAGRERADRLIAQGDTHFADQRFGAAAAKYRDAVAKAPDYPKAHFRLAHCYVGIAKFNLALTRFLMALELAGSADRLNFSLEELYRGDKLAKQHHFERLQDAMLREPDDGGLVFLLALSLHYDQQPFEARALFVRASKMPGAHQRYVHHFLPIVAVAEPE